MRVLFDNGVPDAIARRLDKHVVLLARNLGWDKLANGTLIQAAEDAGFEVLLTNDKNIRYQQNLTTRKIALVVLRTSQWPMVKRHLPAIVQAVDAAVTGSYAEVFIPYR